MSIKLFFMKLAAKKGRRGCVRYAKSVGAPTGEHFMVPREGKKPVEVYIYRPEKSGVLPCVFNVHGGAWVGNDALYLDTQSRQMAERLGAVVVNVNYTKADVKPFPYQQYEVTDTVKFFIRSAARFNVDVDRFAIMGYSAGGHLCAAAGQMLSREGVRLSAQVLCYPFLDFTFGGSDALSKLLAPVFFKELPAEDPICSPGAEKAENLSGMAPVFIVSCGTDDLRHQAAAYMEKLRAVQVPVEELFYEKAIHGYLETNYPETKEYPAKSPEQEKIMHETERDIAERLTKLWAC